jgi:hypothetical protein
VDPGFILTNGSLQTLIGKRFVKIDNSPIETKLADKTIRVLSKDP